MSSFMSVWGPIDPSIGTDYQLIDVVALGANKSAFGVRSSQLVPTALCTSQCGFLSAIGSGEGQIDVYRLFLVILYYILTVPIYSPINYLVPIIGLSYQNI